VLMKAASQPATEGRGHRRTLLISGWSFLHRITVRKGAVVHIPVNDADIMIPISRRCSR
jgi:hypothetical protein